MSIVKEFWKRNRNAFIISAGGGVVIHFYIYSNNLMSPDGIWIGEDYIASWEITLGRWGLELFDRLHAGVNTPILIAFIAIAFFSLGGVLLNECFGVEKPWMRIFVPLCIVSSPLVSITLTYPYCSDAYACAFFLSILSIFVTIKKQGIPWTLGAIGCLTYSLSIYQSNLGVAAGVALLVIFFQILEHHDNLKDHGKLMLRFLVVGVGGVVTYWCILKLLLRLRNLTLGSYKGAESINLLNVLKALPTSTYQAYKDFFDFFTHQNIMVNSYFTRFCYGILFVTFAVFLLLAFIKMRQKPINILCACLILGLLPLACNAVDIVAPQTSIFLLTSGGMAPICPAILVFCSNQWASQKDTAESKPLQWIQLAVSVAAVILIWNNALIVNTDAMVMEANTKQTVALANRVLARVEQSQDYLSGKQVLIAGVPENGNYPIVSELKNNANSYAKWGLIWTSYGGSLNCWQQIFRQMLGVAPNWCSENQYRDIAATQEFQNMPMFPKEGSIKTIQDVVVVKISNIGK